MGPRAGMEWRQCQSAIISTRQIIQEKAQMSAIRDQMKQDVTDQVKEDKSASKDFEGGFGGQEDLEDRYATTR